MDSCGAEIQSYVFVCPSSLAGKVLQLMFAPPVYAVKCSLQVTATAVRL